LPIARSVTACLEIKPLQTNSSTANHMGLRNH